LPDAQVQFVYTIRTGNRVNGLRICDTAVAAGQFNRFGRQLINAHYPDMAERATFLLDPLEPPRIDTEAIAVAITHTPPQIQERLARAARRPGSHIAYIAAHLVMHDTAAELVRAYKSKEPEPIVPSCVVSLGAQSERPFYEARMACRAQGVDVPGLLEATGQLFTRHVLPPYYMSRGGELALGTDAPVLVPDQPPGVLSVQRDLEYLRQVTEAMPCADQS
jgi:hypothetical protein